jgi:hypothetical protein
MRRNPPTALPASYTPLIGNSDPSRWVQVTWDPITAFDMANDTIFPIVAAGGESISDVLLTGAPADRRLKMIPLEIHWLNGSEHSVDGLLVCTSPCPCDAPLVQDTVSQMHWSQHVLKK